MHIRKQQRVDLMRNIWLFERCNRHELDALQRAATEVDVSVGRTLTRQGDVGREFFIIVAGKAEVTRNGNRIAVLGPGSFFGEMSLLDKRPRTATVTTTEPTRVLVMNVRSFDAVVASMPSVDRKMLVVLAGRLRDIEDRGDSDRFEANVRHTRRMAPASG
jgi:CRP/FNR family transcriptional regulator, cyclic AMP receptor protein